MNFIWRVLNKTKLLFGIYVRRDPFLCEARRWFRDNGDDTLRLEYPLLTRDSLVFDIGGYRGDFAAAIHERYGCTVYIFEPVKEFYEYCVSRFKDNHKIICLNYGLSSKDDWLDIGLAENASSFNSPLATKNKDRVEVRCINKIIDELRVKRIDLLKINIEGGEYDVLPALLSSGKIGLVNYLQIQFHNFIQDAKEQRDEIRSQLRRTHVEMWNYPFIWESWKLTEDGKL